MSDDCETIQVLLQQLKKLNLKYIYLVSAGIRTACLIDQFTPSPADCEGIAYAARHAKIAKNLLVVFVESVNQVLVVNRKLLSHNGKHIFSRSLLKQLDSMPPNAHNIIACICEAAQQNSDVVYLTSDTHSAVRRSMIPVVGYLLEYPSIYCLGVEPSYMNITYELTPNTKVGDEAWDPIATSLVNIELYRIELTISLPEKLSSVLHFTKHSMLSFSLPCNLPGAHRAALQHSEDLKAMFDLRISTMEIWPKTPISSSVSEMNLDRVVL